MSDSSGERIANYLAKKEEYDELNRKLALGEANRMQLIGCKSQLDRLEALLSSDDIAAIQAGDLPPQPPKVEVIDILVLRANPIDTEKLELDKEIQAIERHAQEGGHTVKVRFAGLDQLDKWLLLYRPRVVHFCGHGDEWGELLLEKDDGTAAKASAAAIAKLMHLQDWQLDAVVLNACWSEAAANPFTEVANYVIGMREKVGDPVAIAFADGFYRAYAMKGESVPDAFEWAIGRLELHELPADVMKLVTAKLSRKTSPIAEIQMVGLEPPEAMAHRSAPDSDRDDDARLYPLWFGTDREPVDRADLTKGFTGERAMELFTGKCEVSIPKGHKVGSIGSKFLTRLFKGDDRLKLHFDSIQRLLDAAYWQSMIEQVNVFDDQEQKMALVFVHGFNVDFESAALRAAQIGFDLQVPGPMAFYSWPSKGMLKDYFVDSNTALGSAGTLTQYLRKFVAEVSGEVDKIHLIAHSMGNRLLLDAVNKLQHDYDAPVFDQIFLAAADVDLEKFRNECQAYSKVANRTTMYISSKDRALKASEFLNDSDRAGYYEPTVVIPSVFDTIRATHMKKGLGLLGHGYYADARPLLQDMSQMMWDNLPPTSQKRSQISEVAQHLWELRA